MFDLNAYVLTTDEVRRLANECIFLLAEQRDDATTAKLQHNMLLIDGLLTRQGEMMKTLLTEARLAQGKPQ